MSTRAFALACVMAALIVASASAQTRALYSSQQQGSSGITPYSIDLSNGELTSTGPIAPAGTTPTVPAITPDGSKLYVGAYNDSNLHGFAIPGGSITALAGSPFATGPGPNSAVVKPNGAALWSANAGNGSIGAFSIDGAGALSPFSGSPYPVGTNTNAIAASPNSPFVYATDYAGGQLIGLRAAADGNLTPLSGFPLSLTGTPVDVEFNVAGTQLFIANTTNLEISSYSVDPATGALIEITGSPLPSCTGLNAIAATPNGKFLYAACGVGEVRAYAIAGDGSLSSLGGGIPTGSDPYDLSVTPDSRFLYVANYTSMNISGYAIGDSGDLTPLSGSPFGDLSGAVVSLAIVPDQGPTASFSASANGTAVSFNGAASTDPDGSVASFTWNFGDDTPATTTSSPQTAHTYAGPGTYTATLRVTDNENCSNVQIGSGQTLACNGTSAAVTSRSVIIAATIPLTLKHATGKQLSSKKVKGKLQKRVQIEYFLNQNANVSFQFQKSSSKGRCRKAKSKSKKKAKYKNFGKKTTRAGSTGRDRPIFTGNFGGKTIVPGRYRVLLKATATDNGSTASTTSASFCVS